ncbi:heterokaryon incompatibility protein-domain-containing protein [Paraphoma chrysanthemicola]|nr:heterokaryon incompatibility protein-domain-containing protein [Paraphoma chrysanthemicola]
MRLLRIEEQGDFSLVEYTSENVPRYAILSHRWGSDADEATFKDVLENTGKSKPGYIKILKCTQQAARDGYKYVWVDTCCIDKTSSAELSEAINSMWNWYRNSAICYAFLNDVPASDEGAANETAFAKSAWFTRGWTLQELLAPMKLVFYDESWSAIGTRNKLCAAINNITGIGVEYFQGKPIRSASVAARMSWASKRVTKRTEDLAYCLLGVFDVNMPLLYGEGSKAFRRL